MEHPFRLMKKQSGYTTMSYRGLKKNTERLTRRICLSEYSPN
jgi:hypothetical protein